ncbi:MAG: hypothetical protein WD042_05340 [Phycisphaeraceae bacterium]
MTAMNERLEKIRKRRERAHRMLVVVRRKERQAQLEARLQEDPHLRGLLAQEEQLRDKVHFVRVCMARTRTSIICHNRKLAEREAQHEMLATEAEKLAGTLTAVQSKLMDGARRHGAVCKSVAQLTKWIVRQPIRPNNGAAVAEEVAHA